MKTHYILALTLIALLSCTSTREGIYHVSSGKTHIASDEPIGPYQILEGGITYGSTLTFREEQEQTEECVHNNEGMPRCLVLHYSSKCEIPMYPPPPPRCSHVYVEERFPADSLFSDLKLLYDDLRITPCVCIKCYQRQNCY